MEHTTDAPSTGSAFAVARDEEDDLLDYGDDSPVEHAAPLPDLNTPAMARRHSISGDASTAGRGSPMLVEDSVDGPPESDGDVERLASAEARATMLENKLDSIRSIRRADMATITKLKHDIIVIRDAAGTQADEDMNKIGAVEVEVEELTKRIKVLKDLLTGARGLNVRLRDEIKELRTGNMGQQPGAKRPRVDYSSEDEEARPLQAATSAGGGGSEQGKPVPALGSAWEVDALDAESDTESVIFQLEPSKAKGKAPDRPKRTLPFTIRGPTLESQPRFNQAHTAGPSRQGVASGSGARQGVYGSLPKISNAERSLFKNFDASGPPMYVVYVWVYGWARRFVRPNEAKRFGLVVLDPPPLPPGAVRNPNIVYFAAPSMRFFGLSRSASDRTMTSRLIMAFAVCRADKYEIWRAANPGPDGVAPGFRRRTFELKLKLEDVFEYFGDLRIEVAKLFDAIPGAKALCEFAQSFPLSQKFTKAHRDGANNALQHLSTFEWRSRVQGDHYVSLRAEAGARLYMHCIRSNIPLPEGKNYTVRAALSADQEVSQFTTVSSDTETVYDDGSYQENEGFECDW